MPKFSIVVPCYSELSPLQAGASGQRHFRGKTIQRAIKSIQAQQFTDWELILVDDGCADGKTPDILDKFAESDERIRVIHKENENRAVARNVGMEEATGEWICWLDSDDEYVTHYLRELHQATLDFPEYGIFNFGSILHYPDHQTLAQRVYRPEIEEDGHEWFRAGHLGCGSFIFKKELWLSDDKYRIPDEVNPYQFASKSGYPLKLDPVEDEFKYNNTEKPNGAFQDGIHRQGLSLGNPWGDDFLQFYLLTRDNLSKPLDVLLYVVYPRAHEDIYEHFGELYPTD